ncbi:hypothetical protein B0H14DRAFT_3524575 [Mycena olivaceomarginata]|nr:hypothetical protein B0H14DRAFT_3524575 [Mycena olivaceomarginata]
MSDPSVTQNLSGNDGAGLGPSESTTETPAVRVEATPETPAAVVGVGSGSTQMPSQSSSTPEGNVPLAGSADVPPVGSGDAPPGDAAGDGDALRTSLPAGSLLSDLGEVYTPPARPGVVRREKDEWAVASQKKIAGEFYIKMAKLYTVKYEFLLNGDKDFECDVADPSDWVANKVVNEQLTPEETKLCQDYHAKLRDRLGGWYRTQYASLLKEDKATFSEIFGPTGRDEETPTLRARTNASLERQAEMTGVPAPAAILIQNEVTKECWEDEPESLKEEMLREREREHEIHLKAWKESNADGPNRTPEEFSASLKSAAHYLQSFVDIIAEHYGMCVSILMVGPIGEHGGQIEMHSVRSGMTRGLVEKDWPLHDPEGFTRVQTSMVDFGHHVFSQAEREAHHGQAATTSAGGRDSPSTRDSLCGTSMASGVLPVGPLGVAAGTQADENDGRDNDDESRGQQAQGEGEGDGGGVDNEDSEDAVEAKIAKLWQRRDAGKWTEELTRVHRGFEHGKGWGIEWAWLVSRFYDFEAAWGYTDVGGQIMQPALCGPYKWSLAIEDVSDTLKEMLRPGMITKFKKAETKTSDGARGKKRKAVEG